MGVRLVKGNIVADKKWPDKTRTTRVFPTREKAEEVQALMEASILDGTWRECKARIFEGSRLCPGMTLSGAWLSEEFAKQFWAYLDKDLFGECWLWRGNLNEDGYGTFGHGRGEKREVFTHRIAWLLAYGPIGPDLCICHHCDFPPCCRPDHLFIGTHQDNMDDRTLKGRGRGIQNAAHKLSELEVNLVRGLHARGFQKTELARLFNVNRRQIYRIIYRIHWSDLVKQAQVCTVFYAVSKLCEVLGESPIKDKVWTHQVDDHWLIKINGHDKETEGIPPYHMMVDFNGFPAACVSPFEGAFAAGAAANEDEFIEAVKRKLESLGENLDDITEEDRRLAEKAAAVDPEC